MNLLPDDRGIIEELLIVVPFKEVLSLLEDLIIKLIAHEKRSLKLFLLIGETCKNIDINLKRIEDLCQVEYKTYPEKGAIFARDIGVVTTKGSLYVSEFWNDHLRNFLDALYNLLEESKITIHESKSYTGIQEYKWPLEGGHISTTQDYIFTFLSRKQLCFALDNELHQNIITLKEPVFSYAHKPLHIDHFILSFQREKNKHCLIDDFDERLLKELLSNPIALVKGDKIETLPVIRDALNTNRNLRNWAYETYCKRQYGIQWHQLNGFFQPPSPLPSGEVAEFESASFINSIVEGNVIFVHKNPLENFREEIRSDFYERNILTLEDKFKISFIGEELPGWYHTLISSKAAGLRCLTLPLKRKITNKDSNKEQTKTFKIRRRR